MSRSALFDPCSERRCSRRRASSIARPQTAHVTLERRAFASPGVGVGIIGERVGVPEYKGNVALPPVVHPAAGQDFIKRPVQRPSNFGVVE